MIGITGTMIMTEQTQIVGTCAGLPTACLRRSHTLRTQRMNILEPDRFEDDFKRIFQTDEEQRAEDEMIEQAHELIEGKEECQQ